MSEETRDEQFQRVLDAFRTATNIAIGARPDSLYDLLDAVENLIHPDYEGDEGGVHAALDVYEGERIRLETEIADAEAWAEAEDAAEEDAAEEDAAEEEEPTEEHPQITIDGITYNLIPTEQG